MRLYRSATLSIEQSVNEMNNNITSLFERIRQVDFQTATTPTLQAIGGLLWMLIYHHADAPSLLSSLHDVAVRRFGSADTAEEQSRWLWVLIHISGGDKENIFADVLDDDEFTALEARQAETERLWLSSDIDTLSALPLLERMQRLTYFYQQDINTLSGGNDDRARTILNTAAVCFEQCRTEVFSSKDISILLPYYHLLCYARPGRSHPSNTSLYTEYATLLDTLSEGMTDDSDVYWPLQEVLWHAHLETQHPYCDRALLPLLSLADPSACMALRRQCHQWMQLPDFSIQTDHINRNFAAEAISRLLSWLDAKQSASIPVPPEREMEIWRTIACAMNITYTGADLQDRMEERLRALKGTISVPHH